MPKPDRSRRSQSRDRRPHAPPSAASQAGPRSPLPPGRYDAPGDGPIGTESRLTLHAPFAIEPTWVRRLARRDVHAKEAFTLRDASGDYFRASLKELTADGGVAVPYERMARSPEPAIDITLACAVLARQRMIFVMQKATELGVARVVPLLTDHAVPAEGLEHERANAWPAQVVRAAKQCRRASLPEVLPPLSLDGLLASPAFLAADLRVVLDDRSDPRPVAVERPRRVVLFVGPEGGFSDAERATLTDHTSAWLLGGRILRAETAVVVGLTVLQMRWGDFAV